MFVAIVLSFLFLKSLTTLAFDLHASNVTISPPKFICFQKERQALLHFKADSIDDHGLLSSWSNNDDNKNCCEWMGVVCNNQTGHVVELHLPGQYNYPHVNQLLTGKISPSLIHLRHLNYLDLSWNNFSYEPIPKFIGSLTKLNHLDLSYAGFAGTIPSQLGNLSNLHYLDIGSLDSRLVSDLEWLSLLSSLEHLYMDGVDLSKAIHWVDIIKSLPYLLHVEFVDCQLSSVVNPSLSLINSSTSITTLYLTFNGLTSSMFHWLFNLSTSIVNLYLDRNQLKGPIPEDFGKMTSLVKSKDEK